jgi:hypothetical protein
MTVHSLLDISLNPACLIRGRPRGVLVPLPAYIFVIWMPCLPISANLRKSHRFSTFTYSSKDDAFARRLYADLQSNHIRCWFAPEDLKIGDRVRTGIDEAIRVHDKLLLILSKSSVASGWVEREVKAALAKERKEKRTVLFPVRVDKAVFETPFDWATEIRHERNIGDFTRWKDHGEYQKVFDRLLRDLQVQ